MEDSHIAQTNIVPDVSIFGVFDGHGGAEVALYVKKHFIPSLLKNEKFQNGDYSSALYETFLEMDVLIQTKEGQKEVQSLMENEETESMAGCTANVCIVTKTQIICANSGDSRSVVRKNNVNLLILRSLQRYLLTTSLKCPRRIKEQSLRGDMVI